MTDAGLVQLEVRASLGGDEAAWDALLAASRHPTPFASSWWIAHTGGPDRIVLLVRAGDLLVGGLALSRHRRAGVTVLRFPGAEVAAPDHVDLLARPGHEHAVVTAVRRWFDSMGPFVLRAEAVAADGLLATALADRGRAVSFTTAPYLLLDPTTGAQPRSSRVRSTIKRTRSRLQRSDMAHRVVDAPGDDLDAALATLDRLHRLRWPEGSNFARALPALTPVIHAGAALGAASVHELVAAGRVMASMLVFDLPDRRCYYQSGREMDHDARGAGTLLMELVIGDAHRRGMREFDFLRGREPYKLDWTETERPLHRFYAGTGARGRMVAAGLAAFEASKPTLRRIRARLRRG